MKSLAARPVLTRLACGLSVLALLLPALVRADAPAPDDAASPAAAVDSQQAGDAVVQSLHPQKGKINLKDGIAELNVPEEFRYLDPADAKKVLVDLWGNPPDAAEGVLGMLIPASISPAEARSWGAIITFSDSGYVSDGDADKINYADLLKKMQEGQTENNAERTKAGYPAINLVGWAQPPRYDKQAKKMYWAKELKVDGHEQHTLNYDIRILGRRGVLVLEAIAGMKQIDEITTATPQLLSMINFNQGHRYADFNPSTDKKAAFGLAALVGGGLVVAKLGGFKALLVGLLALKKFLIIGVIAVAGFFKKLFGGGTKVNNGPTGLPPAGPGPTGGV